ncbi:MAG TPA: YtxH domain-containing protein [Candidatus Dojkabacteria bacterium]|jgi:gas vesicle protein|nr:YtxH domain-containing protein [Candidatus Dojkabacteria bacterium]
MGDKNKNVAGKVAAGVAIGALAGAAAGVLLAPKSGKETREDIKKFAKDTKEKGLELFEQAKAEVNKKIANVKKAGKKIDAEEYKKIVAEIVETFKGNGKLTEKAAKKLGEQLKSDWDNVKKQIAA